MTLEELIEAQKKGDLERLLSTMASQSPESDYSCSICKDTGWLHFENDQGYRSSKECECRVAQKAQRMIERSGLADLLMRWTFPAFVAVTETQKVMKGTAQRYAQNILDGNKPWLFMGGQVGSGKSHLCTAVCGQLLHSGIGVRYMQWVTDSRSLKATVNDMDAFDRLVTPYLNARLLYIDDLFKSQHKAGEGPKPTDADIRVAFQIINDRYIQDKPTIITSEWHLTADLIDADAGTFSRVYEKCKDYLCEISAGAEKNYRLRS